MNRTNPFILFGRAFKYARKDFWVSAQVLFWITLALSAVVYFVEHKAQPGEYVHIDDAIVWAFTRYIGDPGDFAANDPITLVGRYVCTFIGILKILIFAVPAGLVSNGFRKAISEDNRRIHLEECRDRIVKAFRRKLNKVHHYRVPSRNIPVVTLQAQKGMTENDIIETVTKYPDFRLRNLATSQTRAEYPQDRLVVEMIPLQDQTVDGYKIERTPYGIKINRQSNVTIIAPTSATECSIGYFAYYVAQFGGFNLISREFVADIDDPVSYYIIGDDYREHTKTFVEDIHTLLSNHGEQHWNIAIISADNLYDTQIHLVHRMKKDDITGFTTLDESRFGECYTRLSEVMSTEHQLLCDLDEMYRPVGPLNVCVRAGGGTTNNAFTLRISYSITTWTDNCTAIALDMARALRESLGIDGEFVERQEWKLSGDGYGINLSSQE